MCSHVHIVHERHLDSSPAEVGRLLDSLASDEDRLWPTARWPAMQFDRPLAIGALGGHGPVRYEVWEYDPGRRIRFRFDPAMFDGYHGYEIVSHDGQTVLRHTVEGQPRGLMRLAWPLAIRHLHDAATQDSLDHAEAQLRETPWSPRPLSRGVRALRAIGGVADRTDSTQPT